MKIYTKTGDDGTTGLFNGTRVSKDSLRVETYGTVDELNSIIGIISTMDLYEELNPIVIKLNNLLFNLGSDLASPLNPAPKFDVPRIKNEHIIWLEQQIDKFDEFLPSLTNFVLPGGTFVSAYFQNARTICRRAERLAVNLSKNEDLGEYSIKFLNRLSDFLFTLARVNNHLAGVKDVEWKKDL